MGKETFRLKKAGWLVLCLAGLCLFSVLLLQAGKIRAEAETMTTEAATTESKEQTLDASITPKKIVALDPGHSAKMTGGTEPIGPGSSVKKAKDATGTRGVSSGQMEYELTMKLARKMKPLLEDKGYQVVLTRSNNKKAISCVERAKVANKAGADIFIRIHADGINNASVSGASALYPSSRNPYVGKLSSKSKKLSSCVLNAMCKKTGAKNRGLVARDDLSGSNWAKMPVTLIEVGFMTNPEEDKKLAQNSYQDKLAKGMVQGIEAYFGY